MSPAPQGQKPPFLIKSNSEFADAAHFSLIFASRLHIPVDMKALAQHIPVLQSVVY